MVSPGSAILIACLIVFKGLEEPSLVSLPIAGSTCRSRATDVPKQERVIRGTMRKNFTKLERLTRRDRNLHG